MKNNDIDKSLYSEKSLFLLNIKELRDLGRKFGVPSPTTKKKKELVDYILNVVYGNIQTPVIGSYGRPSKREFDMDKYLDKIKKKSDISNELKNISLKDFGTMKIANFKDVLESEIIETRVFYEDKGKFFLRVREFVASNDDIEISEDIVKRFKLEMFDVVEISKTEDMFKIISINGIKVKTEFEKIDVCGTTLHPGVSRDFYLSTKEEIREKIEKLSSDCEKNDVKFIVFTTKPLEGKTTEFVEYSVKEESSKIYKKLVYLIGLCEKAVFDGLDFIVAIENADYIEKLFNSFEKDISDRIKKYVEQTLPKFASLGNVLILFRHENEVEY